MTTRKPLAASLLAAMLLAACSDDPPTRGPQGPGTVAARIVSSTGANGADGAALLELTGEVTGVTGAGGTDAYTERSGGNVTRVLLVSATGGPLQFTLTLPDRGGRPSVRVIEVADTANVPVANIAGYRVEY